MQGEEQNICKFIPTRQVRDELNIINFVYEKKADFPCMKMTAVSSLHLVTAGCGVLHTPTRSFPLQKGDLFFRLPAKQYRIENGGGLHYIYVSYEGRRAHELTERVHFDERAPVFPGFERLIPLFEEAVLAANEHNGDLAAEGVLLYAVSCLAAKFSAAKNAPKERHDILYIKQYLDEHFTDPTLNLGTVSRMFSYDYRYVSRLFSRTVGIRFHEYLRDLRLATAVRLMENGFISVREVAQRSGFADALYFSKVFAAQVGMPPSEYIRKMGRV